MNRSATLSGMYFILPPSSFLGMSPGATYDTSLSAPRSIATLTATS